MQKKKQIKDKALESFDDFYGSVYGARWKSIRAALLTKHKYMALVNNFGDTQETIEELESEGNWSGQTYWIGLLAKNIDIYRCNKSTFNLQYCQSKPASKCFKFWHKPRRWSTAATTRSKAWQHFATSTSRRSHILLSTKH